MLGTEWTSSYMVCLKCRFLNSSSTTSIQVDAAFRSVYWREPLIELRHRTLSLLTESLLELDLIEIDALDGVPQSLSTDWRLHCHFRLDTLSRRRARTYWRCKFRILASRKIAPPVEVGWLMLSLSIIIAWLLYCFNVSLLTLFQLQLRIHSFHMVLSKRELLAFLHRLAELNFHTFRALFRVFDDLGPDAWYFFELLQLLACDNIDGSAIRNTLKTGRIVRIASNEIFKAGETPLR